MAIRSRRLKAAIAAGTCLVLTACGSAVPPKQFIEAQNALGAFGGNGTNNGNNGNNGNGNLPAGNGTGSNLPTNGASSGANGGGGGNGGSGGGGGNGGSGGGGGSSSGGGGIASGIKIGSCAGFKNGPGVTNSSITLANVADVSGPVPGLFAGVQQAMKAFVAYFNSSSSICGRKLSLVSLDSQTSSTGDQQASTTACSRAFAMVGSMGAFDDGGAQTVTRCGIPDLRTAATEQARINSPVVFGTQSLNASYVPTAPADFYKKQYPGVADKAAFLYLDAGASKLNAENEIAGWKARGFNFVYTAGISVETIDYGSYVTKLKSSGVKYVQFVGAYQYAIRLAQAIQARSDYTPKPLFVMDPVGYDPGFVKSGGSAVEGTHIWINSRTFEEASSIPEMQTYIQWLGRVAPGKSPNYFGIFAWAAGLLFVQKALELGGQLTRSSMINALKGVDNYTGDGMFGPQHVARKVTGSCYGFIVLKGGKWVREGPRPFSCGSTTKV